MLFACFTFDDKRSQILPMTLKSKSSSSSATNTRGRTYSGLSQEQRKAKRCEQFLDAAFELAGTAGFRAMTVRAVCKEAKLTDRYFYESYGSLEKLVMAVYERCMTALVKQVLAQVTQGYQDGDVASAIEAGLDTYFKVLEESRTARICMIELEGISPEVDRLYNSYIQNISKIFVTLTDQAFPNWSISAAEKEVVAISLVGVLRQTATTWLIEEYDKPRSVLVAGTSAVFIGTINQITSQDCC